jgi:hypothetical protein
MERFGSGKRIGAPAHWVAAWRSRATLIPPPDVLDRIQEIIWEWHALYKEVKSLSRQIYGRCRKVAAFFIAGSRQSVSASA